MIKKYVPNILTFINLSFGITSIINIFDQNYLYASLCILAAALVDRYDGRIARYLNVSSEIGKELDSLADLVSFGVAPALIIFTKYNFYTVGFSRILGISLLLLYSICGCYRLAKYNISTFEGVFTGIPITIAGCILALFSLIIPSTINSVVPILSLIVLSYLMVSRIKLKKI
ncbi:CDP-diacylglycerol--serine O-phosphatidyltransferase [Clostridium gasigenes]|uniref:CDP-diacylglycerol--serine O-phosphatidyltransferase n=1 Tax=Clostridium gasigenes TaxID=94869 RepID=A0A1H0QB58_9CLOT|nr:CDP-diacylglycerol--serine O-phosphatidyltransferase [Clostridium gasigenes]MBU3133680.1 CDP-diacylglycerol--serine O-phosphatidyltransferase [Clostridium gasigenes]SDP14430.1 CDP-diacylglycerol---serine O-phosphatidyltransferase [Clostridium gasigenes]